MSDVNENINIKFNISGIDTSKLKGLVEFFKDVSTYSKGSTGNIKSVVDNLSKLSKIKLPDLTKFSQGVKELASFDVKLTKLASNFDQLKTSIKQVSGLKLPSLTAFATGITTISKMSSELLSLRRNIKDVTKTLNSIGDIKLPGVTSFVNGLKKIESLKIGNIRTKIEALAKSIAKLDKSGKLESFANFAKNLNTVAKAADTVTNANKRLSTATLTLSDRFATLRDKLTSYAQYRLVADAVMFAQQAFDNAVESIVDYDQALKDLQAITGATGSEVEKMSKTILEVASTTKFSATEIADGMKTIGQAGFTAAESIEVMGGISNLATGTLSDMNTTVDLVTTALRVFNIEAYNTNTVVDVFANAVNRSKLTIDKLRTAFNYVGPVAENAGVTLEETSAAMMTLANAGLRASTIGTGLRQVFATLLNPTKAFREAVIESGVSMDSLDLRTNSLQSVIEALKYVIDDAGTAFEAFGKRGASAALALVEGNNYGTMADQVGRTGTAAAQAAIQVEGLGIMIKNLSDRMGVLAVALGDLGITDIMKAMVFAGQSLIDVLTRLVSNPIAQWISKTGLLILSIQALVFAINLLNAGIIGKAIAAFSAYISKLVAVNAATLTSTGIIGAFETSILAASTAFVPLTTALGTATVAVRAFFASLGPIGAIVTALGIAISLAFTGEALAGTLGMKKSLSEIAEEADALVDKFENLGNLAKDYKDRTDGMQIGSSELKKESAKLRNELTETAEKFPELYKAASDAADSISIFDGTLTDGGTALEAYQKRVETVKFENLIKSAESTSRSLADSTFWERNSESIKEKIISKLTFTKDDSFSIHEGVLDGLEVIKLFADNTAESFQKAGDIIRSWDMTNLTELQKRLVKDYDKTNASYIKIIQKMQDAGEVSVETTSEEFENLISKTLKSKTAIAGIVATFNQMRVAAKNAAASVQFVDYSEIISPKDLITTLKIYTEQAETELQRHLHNVALLEADGTYNSEQAEAERVTATINHYNDIYNKAKESFNAIKELAGEDSKEYQKALKTKEDAEAKFYDARKDYLVKYLSEATKAEEKILKLTDKYEESSEKHESKLQSIKKKSTTKLEKIHEDYTKRLEKIDEDYQKAIEKIEEKRAKNKKTNVSEINDIELNAESAIREIRERNLSDEAKAASQRKAALNYLQQGLDEIQNFDVETTSEEDLERSKKLLESSLSMTDAFEDQNKAIAHVKNTSEALKKISTFEKDLKDAKLLKEEEELLAKKKQEKADAEAEYNKKVQENKKLTEDLIAQENKRHSNEITNQLKELEVYKEKLRIAQELVSLSGGSVNVSQNVSYNSNIDAIKDNFDELKKQADSAFGNMARSAESSFDTVYSNIREGGVNAFSDVKDSGAKIFEDIFANSAENGEAAFDSVKGKAIELFDDVYAYIDENGVKQFTNAYTNTSFDQYLDETKKSIDDADLKVDPEVDPEGKIPAFKEEIEGIDNLNDEYELTASVNGIDKIDSLIDKIEGLKDKVVTVTTRYVTEGSATITAATGMRLPGFGGGDRRPALLEDGEWVIRKEAVRKYGDMFMNSVNSMTLPGFNTGGSVKPSTYSSSPTNMNNGAGSLKDFGKVVIDTGGMKIPVITNKNVLSEINNHLRRSSLMGVNS